MEEAAVELRIKSIHVLEFFQKEPEHRIGPNETHAIDFSMKVQTDKDNNLVRIVLATDIHESDKASPIIVRIVTALDFKFAEGQLFDADPETAIPMSVLNLLTSITYSTTRGILFAKVGFTSLAQLVLPLMDVKEITQLIRPADKAKSSDTSN